MPISGLIVTLEQDPERRKAALAELHAVAALEIGVQDGQRLAVVADTASPAEDQRLWDSLRACDGVHHVDVVFIHFDEDRSNQACAT